MGETNENSGHCHGPEHGHDHTNSHEHGHHHDHSSIDSIEKMTALLGHLYQHNADHTDDLHGVVDSLNKLGRNDVADKVKEAISEYNKANAVLHDALHLL